MTDSEREALMSEQERLLRAGVPLCDSDCDAECHEAHQITSRKAHPEATCPGTLSSALAAIRGGEKP